MLVRQNSWPLDYELGIIERSFSLPVCDVYNRWKREHFRSYNFFTTFRNIRCLLEKFWTRCKLSHRISWIVKMQKVGRKYIHHKIRLVVTLPSWTLDQRSNSIWWLCKFTNTKLHNEASKQLNVTCFSDCVEHVCMLVESERKYLCMLVSALWRAFQRGVEHDTCGMGHRLLIFSVQYGMVLYSTVHIYKLTLHLGWLPVDSRPVSGILAPAPATPPETSCGTRWTPGDTRGHRRGLIVHTFIISHFILWKSSTTTML